MIPIPEFQTKSELFAFLKANKKEIVSAKKMALKFADPFVFHVFKETESGEITKADPVAGNELADKNMLSAKLVINTTNLMDSHCDVHIPGLWNKSIKEQKDLYLLQEHKMTFENIITDNVTASAKTISWASLGFNFEGSTQALIFSTEIEKDRNTYMFEQYAKGRVKNHSVGMRYVKIEMAINSESEYDKEEKEVWDKYYPMIANKERADEKGYFWAVTEAKVVEGSAVPIGSNFATPVLSIKNIEPSLDTQQFEPPVGTQDTAKNFFINLSKL